MSPNITPEKKSCADLSCGFVLAASGADYTDIAYRTAHSMRAVMPDANIDLFTDQNVEPGPFDQVHQLENSWFRPKFESLRRSRFDRTVYLDSDILVIADISDIFQVLNNFDVAMAHDPLRNSTNGLRKWRQDIPNAFPQLNGGLIGIKSSQQTDRFLIAVEDALRTDKLPKDQPVVRELLYQSELRLAVLPPEYNFFDFPQAETFSDLHTAPRVIHHYRLQPKFSSGGKSITTVRTLVGPYLYAHLQHLISRDQTLGSTSKHRIKPLIEKGFWGRLRVISHKAARNWARFHQSR
jgi:hypothetical protein